MNDGEWIPFMTALAMLGGGRDALRRLIGALMLNRVRSRGVLNYPPGPDENPVEISAELWAEWPIRVEQGALIRPEYDSYQTPVGFVKVRFFRPDIEALAKGAPAPETPPKSEAAAQPSLGRGDDLRIGGIHRSSRIGFNAGFGDQRWTATRFGTINGNG